MEENAPLSELDLTRMLTLDAKRTETYMWECAVRNPDDDVLWQSYMDAHHIYMIMRVSMTETLKRV